MEHENFSDPLEEAKRVAWQDSEDNKFLTNLIKEQGADIFFHKEFPDLNRAFLTELKVVVCIDEGCAHKDVSGEGKLSIAGGGILLEAKSEDERLEIAAKFFKELGIKNITSHEGCGAARMAYMRDNPGSNPTKEQVDNYAIAWADKLAQKMGENFYNIRLSEMERPAEFHNARTVYFDGIGGFNPNREKGLPMGFVISRRHVPETYAAEELKVAASIAFGKNGFGELFTRDNPFVIISFAASSAELDGLKNEITQALQDNENFKDGKIKIDGVVVER